MCLCVKRGGGMQEQELEGRGQRREEASKGYAGTTQKVSRS